jgi:hypothetical protein
VERSVLDISAVGGYGGKADVHQSIRDMEETSRLVFDPRLEKNI